jgi:hypothetical protein
MKPDDIDWKILRGSIVILVVSITVSAFMLYGSFYFQKSMYREFSRNDAHFRTISRRYLAVDEEEKLIRQYYPRFIQLYKKGVIGKEQRLNWIEVLRKTGMDIKVPLLSYQIKSQDAYTPSYSVTLGRFKLYSSEMTLNMRLLHEGDLFSILDKLNRDAKGIYSLNSCRMSPNGTIVEKPDAPNINADCDLQWFTIKLASGKDIHI